MPEIDYAVIADALKFYESKGYERIEVPWSAPKDVIEATAPDKANLYPYKDEYLVASGEQSFMQMLKEDRLKENKKYMCVTPCFRHEQTYDTYTRPYFIKVELFVRGYGGVWESKILGDAKEFFNRYLPREAKVVPTPEGTDLFYNGIELGSYGLRNIEDLGVWVYGTGVAEPRFSSVLSKIPRGYSLSSIPRGKFGEISKIKEEVEELEDAMEQGSYVMSLVELSDILGAIDGFLEKYFPNVDKEELDRMNKITQRAFKNGYRS